MSAGGAIAFIIILPFLAIAIWFGIRLLFMKFCFSIHDANERSKELQRLDPHGIYNTYAYERTEFFKQTGIPFSELVFNDGVEYSPERKREKSGKIAEYEMFQAFNQMKGEKRFLFDVQIPDGDSFQEIDTLVFVTESDGTNIIYVGEAKSWEGKVYYNDNSPCIWKREDKHGNLIIGDSERSPVQQNHRHGMVLFNYLNTIERELSIDATYSLRMYSVTGKDTTIIHTGTEEGKRNVRFNNISSIHNTYNSNELYAKSKNEANLALDESMAKIYEYIREHQPDNLEKRRRIQLRNLNNAELDGTKRQYYFCSINEQCLYRFTIWNSKWNHPDNNDWSWELTDLTDGYAEYLELIDKEKAWSDTAYKWHYGSSLNADNWKDYVKNNQLVYLSDIQGKSELDFAFVQIRRHNDDPENVPGYSKELWISRN